MNHASWSTADLCDAHPESAQVVRAPFRDFGGVSRFSGEIVTLRVVGHYMPVRQELEQPGRGRVLVVDGGITTDRALLGDTLLGIAATNGWTGVVIHGAVRDVAETRKIAVGLRALATCPARADTTGFAERNVVLKIGGVTINAGDWLWADEDGMVVTPRGFSGGRGA